MEVDYGRLAQVLGRPVLIVILRVYRQDVPQGERDLLPAIVLAFHFSATDRLNFPHGNCVASVSSRLCILYIYVASRFISSACVNFVTCIFTAYIVYAKSIYYIRPKSIDCLDENSEYFIYRYTRGD